MDRKSASAMEELVKAHAAAADEDVISLRALSLRQRGVLIESACAAAAALERSRLAAGLPAAEPVAWPASTWAFLKQNAAYFRT